LGVSPRRLGGWEPAITTVFTYDSDGRVASQVSTSEPEFDPEQVDLLLASHLYEKDFGRHGQLMAEAVSERAAATYYGTDRILFAARGPFTDHAEKAYLDAVDAYRTAAGENGNMNGMFWTIERQTF
jgi:hypothetical protein